MPEPLDETAVFCHSVDCSMSDVHQHTETITLNPLTAALVILLTGIVTLPCKHTKILEKIKCARHDFFLSYRCTRFSCKSSPLPA